MLTPSARRAPGRIDVAAVAASRALASRALLDAAVASRPVQKQRYTRRREQIGDVLAIDRRTHRSAGTGRTGTDVGLVQLSPTQRSASKIICSESARARD